MSIPAPYLFWFFLVVITHADALEQLDKVKQPSCDELRLFWEDVNRSRKMGELTNEIPILPWETMPRSNYMGTFNDNKYKTPKIVRGLPLQVMQLQENRMPSPNSHANHNTFNAMHTPASFYSIVLPKQETHVGDIFPSSKEIESFDVGTFGNSFHFGPQLDAKRRSESSQGSWGHPHEVGSFGRFVDFDDQAFLPDGRGSKSKSKNWSDVYFSGHVLPVLKQKSCKEVENRKCTSDLQCSCVSHNLMRCVQGKCSIQSTSLDRDSEYGLWHETALPKMQLGVFKRSIENKDRSTVM